MTPEEPFKSKVKLEVECTDCNSKYRIIYFEDEVNDQIKVCPFCEQPLEEVAETKQETEEVLYTDDEGSLFEHNVEDDDDIGDNQFGDDNDSEEDE